MNRKELIELIDSDLYRYGYNTAKKVPFRVQRTLYGYKYTKTLRQVKYFKSKGNFLLYIFYRLKLDYLSFKYGFQIPYSISVGKGLYIGHFGRVIVNGEAKLGNNINLSPGVTIGMTNRGKKKGVPAIGDNVWIGTNAIIVGGINIGNDVLIAPNSFVNFDVPDHSIVIGNPGVIHYRENATECYIENKS